LFLAYRRDDREAALDDGARRGVAEGLVEPGAAADVREQDGERKSP